MLYLDSLVVVHIYLRERGEACLGPRASVSEVLCAGSSVFCTRYTRCMAARRRLIGSPRPTSPCAVQVRVTTAEAHAANRHSLRARSADRSSAERCNIQRAQWRVRQPTLPPMRLRWCGRALGHSGRGRRATDCPRASERRRYRQLTRGATRAPRAAGHASSYKRWPAVATAALGERRHAARALTGPVVPKIERAHGRGGREETYTGPALTRTNDTRSPQRGANR